MTYQVGDNVRITDGALESFLGIVEEIDTERQKVPGGRVHVRPGDPGGTGPWIKSSPSDPAAVPRAWEERSSAPSNHIFIMEVL